MVQINVSKIVSVYYHLPKIYVIWTAHVRQILKKVFMKEKLNVNVNINIILIQMEKKIV